MINNRTARDIFPYETVYWAEWSDGDDVSASRISAVQLSDAGIPVIILPGTRDLDVLGDSSFTERANFEYMMDNHSEDIMRIDWSHTSGILVRADLPMPNFVAGIDPELEALVELRDTLERLAEYPSLDEDKAVELEWAEWVGSWAVGGYNYLDLLGGLANLDLDIDDIPDAEARLGQVLIELEAFAGETDPGATYPSCPMGDIAKELALYATN